MASIDIIFLAVLGVFAIIGIMKGFFREVLGLAGIIGGFVFGFVLFGPVSKLLSNWLPGIPAIIWPFISFLLIFIGVYLASRLLAGMLSKISKAIYLGWLDKLGGGAIGALKGGILLSVVLMLIGFFPIQSTLDEVRGNSALYQPLQRLLPVTYNIITSFSDSSKNMEKKIINTLKNARVKLSEEMVKYYFYGKDNPADSTK